MSGSHFTEQAGLRRSCVNNTLPQNSHLAQPGFKRTTCDHESNTRPLHHRRNKCSGLCHSFNYKARTVYCSARLKKSKVGPTLSPSIGEPGVGSSLFLAYGIMR
ncbi:hypothetical protein PoB_004960100 [Plakobranchus ocellatus]|uniref:Apple domain-containing protein n=1 Tax=Plakobranchus ocellatus TaxID=259542 RepID=A0AAV4BIC8_9GAST|nr:hypothetical protein PoB_004960100 [Plakobranchus ocellatus]